MALRDAIADGTYEAVAAALEAHRSTASEPVVAEAVTLHVAELPSVGTMLRRLGVARAGAPIRGCGRTAGSGAGGGARDIAENLDKSGITDAPHMHAKYRVPTYVRIQTKLTIDGVRLPSGTMKYIAPEFNGVRSISNYILGHVST